MKLTKALFLAIILSFSSVGIAQHTDPLEDFIRTDSVKLNDVIDDPYSRFNEVNSEMGMFETKALVKSYLDVPLNQSFVIVLDGFIINLILQPDPDMITIEQVKQKLDLKLKRKGVIREDNGKAVIWTSKYYAIQYNYTDKGKRIYVYENPKVE